MADDPPREPNDEEEVEVGGLLDQSAIDALLSGAGSDDDADVPTAMDPDALEALLEPAVDEGEEDDAAESDDDLTIGGEPADEPAAEKTLDQDVLQALLAQSGEVDALDDSEAREIEEDLFGAARTSRWRTEDSPEPEPAGAPAPRPITSAGQSVGDRDLLADVTLVLTAEIGRTDMIIEDVLKLGPGSLVELDKLAGEPVELFVNDRLIARGEVVVVDDNFAVRITEIGS